MPNPASYTPTTWVNGSTAAQASTLNNLESGMSTLYANAGQTGGANTWTGLQTDQVTLSGADKKVHSYKATDGKTFSVYIRSNNHIALHNDTDGVWIWEYDTTGVLQALKAIGAISLDGGAIVSNGAGRLTASDTITSAGNLSAGGVVTTSNSAAFFSDDGSYTVIDGSHAFNVRKNGTHSMRVDTGNNFNVGGTLYGCVIAGNTLFGAGSGNADIAEPLLTTPGTEPGMAVCVVANDTVGPCPHVGCRRAKIISAQPTLLMQPRVRDIESLEPLEGHESAMPVAIGGAVPVQLAPGETVALGDLLTTAGPDAPGKLRKAADHEHVLADVVNIQPDGTVWAWLQ